MAVLDAQANEVVIRIVYDGPPEAGKTTSLRALATSFSQTAVTPEEDGTGRTQWFDWMEYVGGRYEGARIRCQIVSVPGQRELGARRAALLASADVIVFVGDTTTARWGVTLDYLFELRSLRASPGVGIVFQANKRDVDDIVDLATLRGQLGEARWEVAVVESIASDGTGIREAFVHAVRLALDRVREQAAAGELEERGPEIATADALLEKLRAGEGEGTTAAQLIDELFAIEDEPPALPPVPRTVTTQAPRPPDASVPSGAIWPPVEGRAILLEVAELDLVARKHANGDWSSGLGSGWRLLSKADAAFDSLDAGRSALVQWARLHAACTSMVSPRRCIVLAATGDGRWRLWQIVRAEESLRDMVERASAEVAPEEVVDGLCQTAQLLIEVHERLEAAPCHLPCSLDTVGVCDASGLYIGLMPDLSAEDTPDLTTQALIATELGPVLHDLARVLDQKPKLTPRAETVITNLLRLLDPAR